MVSALLLAAGNSWALGLGQIQVKSKRNQPLVAEIPIISTTPGELAALQARLASPETFRRIGLSPPTGAAADLQFSLGNDGRGRPVIRVTTLKPVDQDALNFLIEVDWGSGRLVREYSALVDTPTTTGAVVQPAVQLPQSPDANLVQRPQPEPPSAPPAAPIAAPAPAPAPVAVPPPAPPAAPPPVVAVEPLPVPEASVVPVPVAKASKPAVDQYGPVKRGETLSKIAGAVGLRRDFSLDQSMLALLRANPDAFLGDDVNRLRSGAVLRVPGHEDVAKIDADEAAQVVRQQMQQWQQARRAVRQPETRAATAAPATEHVPVAKLAASVDAEPKTRPVAKPDAAAPKPAAKPKREVAKVAAPVVQPARPAQPQAKPQQRNEARLQIVPPTGPGKATGMKSGTDAGGKGSMLQQELRQRDEDIAAKSAEIGELKDRVASLEKLKDEQQKLISLKDTELATAQSRLAQANQAAAQAKAQAVVPAVAPAATAAASSQPAPAVETPSHNAMPYVWGGVGFAALALLAWLLAGRRKPAPPVRRSLFDSETLAASMVVPTGAMAGTSDAAPDEIDEAAPVAHAASIDLADLPATPPRMETPAWHSGWVKSEPAAASAPAAPVAPASAPASIAADAVPAHASIEQRFKLVDALLDMGDKQSAQQILAELLHDEDDDASAKAATMLSRLVG